MSGNSLRDAFMTSEQGQKLIVQAQERKANIANRIRTLKELVHFTFVEYPKNNDRTVRFDVYMDSKERMRQLGVEGGPAYERVLNLVKFARNSKPDYCDAIDALLPLPAKK